MAEKEINVAYVHGPASFAYTGHLHETGSWKKGYKDEYPVKDADGDTVSKLLQDPFDEITITLFINGGGSVTPPAKGDTITITDYAGASVNFMCEDASNDFQVDHTKLTMTLIKEAGMTYTT